MAEFNMDVDGDMQMSDFESFFRAATSSSGSPGFSPYPFQQRLALDDELPEQVEIPTGMGKTEAVVLAWLWRRRFADESVRAVTPRRLIYCLPMRVLVEQTLERVGRMLETLGIKADHASDERALEGWAASHLVKGRRIPVHVAMGGEGIGNWDADPDQDAIIVGTQDMLLSAALNRAFATNRYRWPMKFAALNNDCLWVLDEVQLMGAGLPTSVQLQAFRERLGTWRNCRSIWMSATLDPRTLETVDRPGDHLGAAFGLEEADLAFPAVKQLVEADKPLSVEPEPKKPALLASQVVAKHRPGTLTLVVMNTVKRAVEAHRALGRIIPDGTDLRLVHSRFRPAERRSWQEAFLSKNALMPPQGRIIVSTQVVEAGVDLSAATLMTEAAPWSSLVQRFGRCNRAGEFGQEGPTPARIIVWDVADANPYDAGDLNAGIRLARELSGGGIHCLRGVSAPESTVQMASILRKKDLIDLFDTTPDLTGNDLDVQRWIRDGAQADLFLYWRDGPPSEDDPRPIRDELCPVPIGAARELVKRATVEWFDTLDELWKQVVESDVRPGRMLRCRAADGGYRVDAGFDVRHKKAVPVVVLPRKDVFDAHNRDPASQGEWMDIATHTDHVVLALAGMIDVLGLPADMKGPLLTAARWHDRGKAIGAFQARLSVESRPLEWRTRPDVAKAPNDAWSRARAPRIRHELASALAMLQAGLPDLAAYLVAAHHGKVRMALRALPGEAASDPTHRICCGIHDGDLLPEVSLGDDVVAPAVAIDLEVMEMGVSSDGRESWVDRTSRVLDAFGPFSLAYMELLLRAADWRGSAADTAGGGTHA